MSDKTTPEGERIRFGPGQIFTGWGKRGPDGLVADLLFRGKEPTLSIQKAKILELHDINIAERHAGREVAWYLKRSLALLQAEGVLLLHKGELYFVPPERLDAQGVRYQQFFSPSNTRGPFRA